MSGGVRALAIVAALLVAVSACGRSDAHTPRVVVLGFDGMDYELTRELMARGRLPNLAALAARGTFASLATANPPQSPVAWSTFITGLDPGGHGVFDFIHRDPKTMQPYLSTSRTVPAGRELRVGGWQVPLSSGRIELLRHGTPFWEVLKTHGIETTILRMPANFPPSGTATRELSGMGTPDLLGGYGTFSFFTSDPAAATDRSLSGGVVFRVDATGGVVRGALEGPDNPFRSAPEKVTAAFAAYVDASRKFVKLVIGDETRLLAAGEWSDWVPVRFSLGVGQSLQAEYRFYVRQLDPSFQLYASPPNMDPEAPAMPISSPAAYATELARASGRFYSQGMPEETKALKTGLLTPAEFLAQAGIAGSEVEQQYDYVLDRFERGLLFYYVGNVDQISHMMWRARDPRHPAYDATRDEAFARVIEERYVALDAMVGRTMKKLRPEDLLVVMSDHGFTSWRRSFNLNGWLRDNGYLALRSSEATDGSVPFENVDWSRTRAYGLGLNGLYLNVRGREAWGIVDPNERAALMREIAAKLQAAHDPASGEAMVSHVYRRDEAYSSGFDDVAPDLVVGYAKGIRSSDESSLGGVPAGVVSINQAPWNGDHCMDPAAVPGILFSSRPLKTPAPSLQRLAGAILSEFGIDGFPFVETH